MLATWGCTTFPKPTLSLDFLGATSLDSRITFSRGSQATLFDSTGTLVYAKHNLLLQSQTFQTTWLAVRASISSDVIAAPDGTLTADLGIEDTSTNTHNPALQDVTILANGTYTASGYFKSQVRFRGSLQFSSIDSANFAAANFNLSAGTVTTSSSGTGTVVSASITDVGNGWFRVTITGSIGSGLTTGRWILRLADASGNIAYTGDGTSGLYLWGAQLNITNMEGGVTSSLSTYYPTTTAAYYAPRFDYNPSTLQPRGLLIEEQRTNSIRNNTMQGAVVGNPGTDPTNWSVTNIGLTKEIVSVGTENGINYIDIKLSGTTTSQFGRIDFEPITGIAASAAQVWAQSFYAKIIAGSTANIGQLGLGILYYTSGSVFITSSTTAITLTNTLTRYSQAVTAPATTAYMRPSFYFNASAASGQAIDITLRIGLPQLELGAFATSVIPTTTTALTRNADVATMTGTNFSSWYNASEGTLFGEGAFLAISNSQSPHLVSIGDPSLAFASRNISASINRQTSTANVSFRITSAGTSQLSVDVGSVAAATAFKSAIAYGTNNGAASLNGSVPTTDTSVTVPAVTTLILGDAGWSAPSGTKLNGWIGRLSYYPTRLPNTTLQALTA